MYNRIVSIIVIVLIFTISSCAYLPFGGRETWDTIDQRLKANNVKTISVISAKFGERENSTYKSFIESNLLSLPGDYMVLERSMETLYDVINNLKYESSDLFDPKLVGNYGKFIGAQAVVIGQGNVLKIIHVESTRIIFNGTLRSPIKNNMRAFKGVSVLGCVLFVSLLYLLHYYTPVIWTASPFRSRKNRIADITPRISLYSLFVSLAFIVGNILGIYLGDTLILALFGVALPSLFVIAVTNHAYLKPKDHRYISRYAHGTLSKAGDDSFTFFNSPYEAKFLRWACSLIICFQIIVMVLRLQI